VAFATLVAVRNTAELRAALGEATAGWEILLAPGRYGGGSYRANLHGTAATPIVSRGADPDDPPVIVGGSNGLGFSDVSYLTLEDLTFEQPQQNGINIDDGETFETPSHHVEIRRVTVRDLLPGNHDGIKLSGVTDFVVEQVTIERWGNQGSAIDMVGCHRGAIRDSLFRHTPDMEFGNGVQTKGGSADIVIADNRFEYAAARAVQMGGPTSPQFFRPQPPDPAEARNVVVERNVFVGGETAVAFVNSDGGTFRFNTVYRPTRFLLRILRENVSPGFTTARRGAITDNLVFWTGDVVVNVGAGTEPATFSFARNHWYRADTPGRSQPNLPSRETGGVYGIAPEFVTPPDDLRTRPALPAGAYAR
jgi:hypothetical protein